MANVAVMVGAYTYTFMIDTEEEDGDISDGNISDSNLQQTTWLKFVYKSMDFCSGRERGARNWIDLLAV